ncbi:MAG: hypothetical protein H0W18_15630, partial [Acidobacteria bacterium]|nr:hypothetical protein [Acidobacteriota bacterium]
LRRLGNLVEGNAASLTFAAESWAKLVAIGHDKAYVAASLLPGGFV